MAHDLLWVCDELYRLHQDLEEIKQRQAEVQTTKTFDAAQLPIVQGSTINMPDGNSLKVLV